MRVTLRGCGAAVLLALCIATPAMAQLDLSTEGGAVWLVKDVGIADTSTDYAKPDYTGATAANGWVEVTVPADLNAEGTIGENTDFWYRLSGLKIPSGWAQDGYLVLEGFNVDDRDVTYFNGTRIGSGTTWDAIRRYIVPAEIVNWTGDNVIAIKASQDAGGAGMSNGAPTLGPGDPNTGVLLIRATDARKNDAPAPNVLVSYKNADGIDTDVTTDSSGQILLLDLPKGDFPIQVDSYPWTGTITPSGTITVPIEGGKASVIDLKIQGFTYNVLKATTPIVIDGVIDGPEWAGATEMLVDATRQLAAGGGATNWDGPADLSGKAKWKWDDTYIYMAADVKDDNIVNNYLPDMTSWGSLWQGDGFETYIQLDQYDPKRTVYKNDRNYQWTMGVDKDLNIGWKIFRAPVGDKLPPDDIPEPGDNAKAVKTATGYILEARFPWAKLPDVAADLIPPKPNSPGAIALAINDVDTDDSTSRESQASWNTKGDMWTNPASYTAAVWAVGSSVKSGDLNNDGKINVQDATLSLRIAVGLLTPTDAQKDAGDVNNDGKWNIQDTTLILQVAVGNKPESDLK